MYIIHNIYMYICVCFLCVYMKRTRIGFYFLVVHASLMQSKFYLKCNFNKFALLIISLRY